MPRDGKYAESTWLLPATRVALWSANSLVSIVASPAGFQKAASPCPSAAIAVWPMATARAPTGKTRKSAPVLSGGSCPARRPVGCRVSSAASASSPPLEGLRLIDQHDRDVILDGIHEVAGVAGERLGG